MGCPNPKFDGLFTRDRPVIFAYHGYPSLIHRLVIATATTTTFMSAATKRKERQPHRSIWR